MFRADGQVVPVTVLKAGPCVVVQRKTPATDGYDAVQLGFMEYAKKKGVSKPAAGHLKKSGAEGVKFQREFRLDSLNGDMKTGRMNRDSVDNCVWLCASRFVGSLCDPTSQKRDVGHPGSWLCKPLVSYRMIAVRFLQARLARHSMPHSA